MGDFEFIVSIREGGGTVRIKDFCLQNACMTDLIKLLHTSKPYREAGHSHPDCMYVRLTPAMNDIIISIGYYTVLYTYIVTAGPASLSRYKHLNNEASKTFSKERKLC